MTNEWGKWKCLLFAFGDFNIHFRIIPTRVPEKKRFDRRTYIQTINKVDNPNKKSSTFADSSIGL